jgi:hypothetical protein
VPRKSKSQPEKAQWGQRAKIVEEFAALDQAVANFKPAIFRHQKLRELILGWYPGLEPEDEVTVPGVNCDIVVSARDKIRSVTLNGKQKLFTLWGKTGFIANSTILLKSLPDPKDLDGLYTVTGLIGPRHLRVISKARAAAAGNSAAA